MSENLYPVGDGVTDDTAAIQAGGRLRPPGARPIEVRVGASVCVVWAVSAERKGEESG